jgi:hypothetical protein
MSEFPEIAAPPGAIMSSLDIATNLGPHPLAVALAERDHARDLFAREEAHAHQAALILRETYLDPDDMPAGVWAAIRLLAGDDL